MKEQRSGTRRPLTLQCRVNGDSPSDYLPCELVTADLSPGGLFLVCENLELLKLEQEIDIEISRAAEPLFRGPARVVRAQKLGEGTGPSGFGLELLTVDYGLSRLLEAELSSESSNRR